MLVFFFVQFLDILIHVLYQNPVRFTFQSEWFNVRFMNVCCSKMSIKALYLLNVNVRFCVFYFVGQVCLNLQMLIQTKAVQYGDPLSYESVVGFLMGILE